MLKRNRRQMTIFDVLQEKKIQKFSTLLRTLPKVDTFPTLSTLVKMHSGTPFYVASFPLQNISGKTISQIRGLSMKRAEKLAGLRFLVLWKKVLCCN